MKVSWRFRLLSVLILVLGCSSYNVRPDMAPEARLELARKMFQNKDYRQALTQFKILTLNNPGAKFVDEAQYFLAECHFRLKEYILASDEYQRLIRLYPRSKWVERAEFMLAMCDYKQSPKYSLDQKYTLQAVANFQRFLEDFPNSELAPEAERLLKICRTKLARKEFATAELYRKFDDYYAALVYYESVWNSYYDTRFAERALYWRSECLYRVDRKEEALESFRQLIIKFPKTGFRSEARNRMTEIEAELLKQRAEAQATDGNAENGKKPKKQF